MPVNSTAQSKEMGATGFSGEALLWRLVSNAAPAIHSLLIFVERDLKMIFAAHSSAQNNH